MPSQQAINQAGMTEYLDFHSRLSGWGVKHSDLMCASDDKESII